MPIFLNAGLRPGLAINELQRGFACYISLGIRVGLHLRKALILSHVFFKRPFSKVKKIKNVNLRSQE